MPESRRNLWSDVEGMNVKWTEWSRYVVVLVNVIFILPDFTSFDDSFTNPDIVFVFSKAYN